MELYEGIAILEVDGYEVEITKLSIKTETGRKPVKTMTSKALVKGFARGITEYTLSVTAVLPLENKINWAAIEDARLTVYPLGHEGKRVSYLHCFALNVGDEYTVDNEASIDIELQATEKVEE